MTLDDTLETVLETFNKMEKNEAVSKISDKHRDLLLLEVCCLLYLIFVFILHRD